MEMVYRRSNDKLKEEAKRREERSSMLQNEEAANK